MPKDYERPPFPIYLSLGICCIMPTNTTSFAPLSIDHLVMVMADQTNVEAWWWIDLIGMQGRLLPKDALIHTLAQERRMIVCPSAKETLKKLLIKPAPELRWLCLSTIKKLLSKSVS